jgi:hypothetical protein
MTERRPALWSMGVGGDVVSIGLAESEWDDDGDPSSTGSGSIRRNELRFRTRRRSSSCSARGAGSFVDDRLSMRERNTLVADPPDFASAVDSSAFVTGSDSVLESVFNAPGLNDDDADLILTLDTFLNILLPHFLCGSPLPPFAGGEADAGVDWERVEEAAWSD